MLNEHGLLLSTGDTDVTCLASALLMVYRSPASPAPPVPCAHSSLDVGNRFADFAQRAECIAIEGEP